MRITRRSFLAGLGAGLVIGVELSYTEREPQPHQIRNCNKPINAELLKRLGFRLT